MDDNIHNLRDALEWLYSSIRDEAELDGEMSNDHAIQLGFITNMLEKFPLRNCDVGTAEEQSERFSNFCKIESSASGVYCTGCRAICYGKDKCELVWAQMPYEAKEGGAA